MSRTTVYICDRCKKPIKELLKHADLTILDKGEEKIMTLDFDESCYDELSMNVPFTSLLDIE